MIGILKRFRKTEKTDNIEENKKEDSNYKYSFKNRYEAFKQIAMHFNVSSQEDFRKFENSGLNIIQFINANGYSYEKIAKILADANKKEYKEKIEEDVLYQEGYLIGKETGKTYHYLPISDIIVPYPEYLDKKRPNIQNTEKGEVQSYIFELFSKSLNIDMTDLFLEPDLNYYYIQYKELGGGKRKLEIIEKQRGILIVNALKVMASKTKDSNIKVNVNNEAQSGKIRVDELGIEIRIEFTPTILGEAVSMRFFKIGGYFNTKLEDLGYSEEIINIADHISKLSKGMVLVSGATGQGKSTFIRSIILRANPDVKVIRAVEDPVESIIKGVSHVQVKEGIISFSSAIRSFMRANPDIIFVGEVRDPETAIALIEASITGHLTFSTTHATSSITAISRVISKAQETNLYSREELLTNIATSLVASFTQRLVKLTEKGQAEYGRKVLPVVEYFVPEKEDRELIERGDLLTLQFKLKEEKRDISTILKDMFDRGYIDYETYIANTEELNV